MTRSLALAAFLILSTACGGAASSEDRTASVAPSGSTGAAPMKVDLVTLFPAGPGREIVLGSCQNCHTFVPIVILQLDKDAWRRNGMNHRDRVASLTDEQFAQAYAYLAEHFGPHRPVPQLPPELLQSWTTY